MTIRVAIAEDQRMVRELLAALLAKEPDMQVVGEASTGREALSVAEATHPDVFLVDVGLPGLDGIEVARTLHTRQQTMKLIALSGHTERRIVHGMLDAGVSGYVVKSAALAELVQAIRAVVQEQLYLSPQVSREVLAGSASAAPRVSELGRRERQVLALLAEGKRSVDIATQLEISVATVEVHRRNIMRKLSLHTVAELTKYAIREGLTSL